MQKLGLTNNQLKLIGLIAMTVDHIGMLLFPRMLFLRVIGRLAFPIFAYVVAEGCRYTRSVPKYLGTMAVVALLCQIVSFVATGSLDQCILVTFTLSVCLIFLLRKATAKRNVFWFMAVIFATAFVFVITELLSGKNFSVDYGFMGVMLPVCVYAAKNRKMQLAVSRYA